MYKCRVIARLEIKGEFVVKGIRMEGLRRVGKPEDMCQQYFQQGIDEIIFVDTVASLYGRNHLTSLITNAAQKIFIPLCVGGGVRSIEDFRTMLRQGADKVTINTRALECPNIITEAAKIFGSQCVIVSIQAKRRKDGVWEAFCENGRRAMGIDVVQWARQVQELGGGEILLTSIDRDGTKFGYDHELIRAVTDQVSIPVIAAGGANSIEDMAKAVKVAKANAICLSHILHFNKISLADIKNGLAEHDILVRTEGEHLTCV